MYINSTVLRNGDICRNNHDVNIAGNGTRSNIFVRAKLALETSLETYAAEEKTNKKHVRYCFVCSDTCERIDGGKLIYVGKAEKAEMAALFVDRKNSHTLATLTYYTRPVLLEELITYILCYYYY